MTGQDEVRSLGGVVETHAVRGVAVKVVSLRSKEDQLRYNSCATRRAVPLARWSGDVEARTREKRRSGRRFGKLLGLWIGGRPIIRRDEILFISQPAVLPHLRLVSSTPSARSISTAMSRTSGTTTEFPSS